MTFLTALLRKHFDTIPLTSWADDPKKKIYSVKLRYVGFEHSDWLKNLE